MCGICAIITKKETSINKQVSYLLYEGLIALQHRGQDACGIITGSIDTKKKYRVRGLGLVRNIFNSSVLKDMVGNIGIGHVRYPTEGAKTTKEIQPFYIKLPFGISLCHNGNINNMEEIREKIPHIVNESSSDSEILLHYISTLFLNEIINDSDISVDNIIKKSIKTVMETVFGSYSVVMMINNYGLVAFRDKRGIRPLILGKNNDDYCICSESVALDVLDYKLVRDILPGEIVIINEDNFISYETGTSMYTPCIFEYIYISRPDSIYNSISVYEARLNMGLYLGNKIKTEWSEILPNLDMIIPVPDTSRPFCVSIGQVIKKPIREVLIKNRYIDRTFIMPNQKRRQKNIKRKLNIISYMVENKNVLLVDDSIVRGNTAKYIVSMIRKAGAKNIYLASCAPEIKYSNIFGIDIPTQENLIAATRNNEQIATYLGVDGLIYQDLNDLNKAVLDILPEKYKNKKFRFECSIFDGVYA